jgi:hypothetical protein
MSQHQEKFLQQWAIERYGAHPRVRLARINTGVGWFNDNGPCRITDEGKRPVRFNPKGTGDVVGLVAPTGRMFMLEFKQEGGDRRKAQLVMHKVINAFGGLHAFCETREDVDAAMAQLGIVL